MDQTIVKLSPQHVCLRTGRRRLLRTLGIGGLSALFGSSRPRLGSAFEQSQTSDEPRSRFLSVNGVRLHYLDWGNENARPLVLLHAAPLNAHAWDTFARAMAPFFRVVVPDARGFGDSERAGSIDNDTLVQDVHALVIALGLKRFVLCGNSMGGSVAMAYASLHSELVERLILVDTGPGEKVAEPPPPGARAPGPPALPTGPFASVADAVAQVAAVGGPQFARIITHENLRRDSSGTWQWKFDHSIAASGFERSMKDPRRWSRWMAVRCPTLVLRGSRSPAMSQRAAQQMVSENVNATLVVIPDAGHFIAQEQPAAFDKAVRSWLDIGP